MTNYKIQSIVKKKPQKLKFIKIVVVLSDVSEFNSKPKNLN